MGRLGGLCMEPRSGSDVSCWVSWELLILGAGLPHFEGNANDIYPWKQEARYPGHY